MQDSLEQDWHLVVCYCLGQKLWWFGSLDQPHFDGSQSGWIGDFLAHEFGFELDFLVLEAACDASSFPFSSMVVLLKRL